MRASAILRRLAWTALLVPCLSLAADAEPASRPNAQPYVPMGTRPVDVVVVLDTSGSMENLLNAVRARLWDVVNELSRMKPTPELRVGLVTFGVAEAPADDGWIVVESDLTNDLDEVYGVLMSLTTGGSEELVGRALDTALAEMTWSRDLESLKVVFVAGNESADQGVETHDFREAVRDATSRDVIVNALYAGNREQAIAEKWHEIAQQGRGSFAAIDPETSTIQIAAPQDETLLELNRRLNGTYLPYGPNGANGLANQLAQDGNASRLGVQSCSSRIVAKGSALYTNASWDLVDRSLQDDFDWAALDESDLPEALGPLSEEQRIERVEQMRASREAVQLEIQELSREREQYIRAVLAEQQQAQGLDDAMREAIRSQAKTKGFTCEDC